LVKLGLALAGFALWVAPAGAVGTGTIGGTTSVVYSGQIVDYTVTLTGVYEISAVGAAGGASFALASTGWYANAGGSGASVVGDFVLNAGQVIEVLVGGGGKPSSARSPATGGGGGSFVVNKTGMTPLAVAGGGGGGNGLAPGELGLGGSAGTSGSTPPHDSISYSGTGGSAGQGGGAAGLYEGGGGGGFYGNGGDAGLGGTGGISFSAGGAGGLVGGGFGGGGGHGGGSGGGGGYSGGGGGEFQGGGGGSFLSAAATHPVLIAGANGAGSGGNGQVNFRLLTAIAPAVPEPGSLALFLVGLMAIGLTVQRRGVSAIPNP
jgi:hypothetical protein